MKHIRILALLLALCLCLSACGSTAASSSGDASTSASTSADTSEDSEETDVTIPEEALVDVVSYLTDGAYAADDVIATVGDTEVTAAEVIYWTVYQQYYMTYYYYYYYGYSISMSDELSDGVTLGDSLLSYGLQSAIYYAVGAEKAAEYDVALSEDDAAELESLYADNVTSYGQDRWDTYVEAGLLDEDDYTDEEMEAWIQAQGEEYYLHSLMYYGTTAAGYQSVYNNIYYTFALQDDLFADDGEYAITDETLSDYMAAYVEDNGLCWARCILFSTTDCEDEDAVSEVQAQAQQVYEELSALSGDELSEAFTEMQSEYDTSGYTAGEIQYYTNSDSLVDGYYDGIQALEVGQIGMTEETDYGYFILLREEDQLDDEDLVSTVESSYISTTFDALLEQWAEEYGVGDFEALDMDTDAFYDVLAELQEILYEIDSV